MLDRDYAMLARAYLDSSVMQMQMQMQIEQLQEEVPQSQIISFLKKHVPQF